MAITETYYVVVPEGEDINDSSAVWESDIDAAKTQGAYEIKDSCSGFPNYTIYEVSVTPKYYSSVEISWDRA